MPVEKYQINVTGDTGAIPQLLDVLSQMSVIKTDTEVYAADADVARIAAQAAAAQAGTITTQAATATTQAGIATTQAGIATTRAGIATTQAGIATTQAGIATTRATAAGVSASASAADRVQTGLDRVAAAASSARIDLGALDSAVAATSSAVTLLSPLLVLRRRTLFLSSVVDGVLDTAAKIESINAAMADTDIRDVVFDRSYNITMARTAAVNGSTMDIFRIPAGRRLHGNPMQPIDCTAWDTASVTSGRVRYLFTARGTEGTAVNLTSDLARNKSTVTMGSAGMSALGLVRGDKVRITSDKVFIAGSAVGTTEQGEIAEVLFVGPNSFEIMPPAQDDYALGNSARVHKLAMAEGISMDGIRAIGPGFCNNAGAPVIGDRMLHMVLCDGLALDGLESDYFDNGNYLYSCTDGYARDMKVKFRECPIVSGVPFREVNQYGIALINACQDFEVTSAHITCGKHGLVQSESNIARGVTRRCSFKDSTVLGTWNFGIATHVNGEQLLVQNNQVLDCSGGVEMGCRSMVSRNNTVRGLRYKAGFLGIGFAVTDVAENILSDGDRSFGGGFGFRCDSSFGAFLSGSVGPTDITIKNFHAEDANQDGIRINWLNAGARADFNLSNITTRGIGRPVDSGGHPSTGASLAAQSIEIRGGVSGNLSRVKIAGAALEGWAGSVAQCIFTQYVNGLHVSDISYNNHAAPALGGTAIVSDNVNAW